MATECLTAFGALPLLPFLLKKLLNTMLLDIFKVINHAHMVKGTVALIECL